LCDNLIGKYEPILIILSLLHSALNCGRSQYIIRHHTSKCFRITLRNVMFSRTTLHDIYSIQKCDVSFIYSKYLQKCHILDRMSVPINLQCSMCSKYLQSAQTISTISTHACFALCTPRCANVSK